MWQGGHEMPWVLKFVVLLKSGRQKSQEKAKKTNLFAFSTCQFSCLDMKSFFIWTVSKRNYFLAPKRVFL